jgi:hypothetical protein
MNAIFLSTAPAANGGYYCMSAPLGYGLTITFVVGKLVEPVDSCESAPKHSLVNPFGSFVS